MRIVGGALGGRRFAGPSGKGTRPTSERVREALASALEARGLLRGARVLDLFAGTGALAFEALSRGATRALLVDVDRRLVRDLEASAHELGLHDRVRAVALDLGGAPATVAEKLSRFGDAFDLVFADPPYTDIDRVPPLLDALLARNMITADTVVVLEHATRQPPRSLGRLASFADYQYGDTSIVLARPALLGDPP